MVGTMPRTVLGSRPCIGHARMRNIPRGLSGSVTGVYRRALRCHLALPSTTDVLDNRAAADR